MRVLDGFEEVEVAVACEVFVELGEGHSDNSTYFDLCECVDNILILVFKHLHLCPDRLFKYLSLIVDLFGPTRVSRIEQHISLGVPELHPLIQNLIRLKDHLPLSPRCC